MSRMEIMKEDVFRKQLKQGLSGGYLFFGDEDYLKSFAMSAARKTVCPDETFGVFNDVRLDSLDYSASALLNALMPPPMMSEQKIVTVSGLNLNALRGGELDDLCETLGELSRYDYNVLILSVPAGQLEVGTPKKLSAILTRLSELLTPVCFDPISGAKLVSWVGKHFQHHGAEADPQVCSYLIDYSGRSMTVLDKETEKLSFYVLAQGRTRVTREDVTEVAVPEISADSFALTNAILDGRQEDAMNTLAVMRFRRVEPVIILSEVSKSVCDMISVKALQEEGYPLGEICALLKMKEYRARRCMSGASKKSMKRLRRAVTLCSEADLLLKQSPQGYQAIERLIGTL